MTVATHLVTADFRGYFPGARITADVLIRDNVRGVAAATGLTPPLGYVGGGTKASVENGVLLDSSGSTGVVLTSNDAQLNLAGALQYTFEFFDVKIDGVYTPEAISNITYNAPTGSTAVDLIEQIDTGGMVGITPLPQVPSTGISDAPPFAQGFLRAADTQADARTYLGIAGSGAEWESYANLAAFPGTGNASLEYVAQDTGKLYRWNGSGYVQIADKASVGLGAADNTSDINKPVSTAQATADTAVLTSATGRAIAFSIALG
jgi:hypothetical protein